MPVRRIVVAPSGFKESLSATEAAEAIATGVRRVLPDALIDDLPLVDGGDGSAAAMAAATGGRLVPVRVTGPVGREVHSHIAILGGDGPATAMVEMAAAAGLALVPRSERDPGATTSYGVGQLITAALDAGVKRILVGCGDSGTCDGGVGALQALGARVSDTQGQPVGRGGAALADVATLDLSGLDQRLAEVEIVVAVNPHNVLSGERGVARVFGPQKGATPEQVESLAAAMEKWAAILDEVVGIDVATLQGSGASGGLGAGLVAIGAQLIPRYEVMLDHVDLDHAIAGADLVLTAEGGIDEQTPHGKVPAEVARRAKRFGKPVIALAGTVGTRADLNYDVGIDAIAAILPGPLDLGQALAGASQYLADATERTLRIMLVGSDLG